MKITTQKELIDILNLKTDLDDYRIKAYDIQAYDIEDYYYNPLNVNQFQEEENN